MNIAGYIIGYLFIAYLTMYFLWRKEKRNLSRDGEIVFVFMGLGWPITFTVFSVFVIVSYINPWKVFPKIEKICSSIYKLIPFDKIENKLVNLKTKGYKTYVQTNSNDR